MPWTCSIIWELEMFKSRQRMCSGFLLVASFTLCYYCSLWCLCVYLGGGAWTSGLTDMYQFLSVDLGYRQVITAVATQGRRGSREFVSEYYLWFSSDNKTWTVYTNEYGTPLVGCHNFFSASIINFLFLVIYYCRPIVLHLCFIWANWTDIL